MALKYFSFCSEEWTVASLATVGTEENSACWACSITPAGVFLNHLASAKCGVRVRVRVGISTLELILEYFWKIQLIIPTTNYSMALYRVFEFRSWHRPKLEHTRKALLTRILCWRLCSYDLKPGLPIDVFALYSTLFITMINHSTTHSCVCVEWVGCGTNAEHTWFWTFDYTNRCWTPALV